MRASRLEAMASGRTEIGLPVLQKDGGDHGRKGSAMTKRGAYAAISYMASAGSFFTFLLSIM